MACRAFCSGVRARPAKSPGRTATFGNSAAFAWGSAGFVLYLVMLWSWRRRLLLALLPLGIVLGEMRERLIAVGRMMARVEAVFLLRKMLRFEAGKIDQLRVALADHRDARFFRKDARDEIAELFAQAAQQAGIALGSGALHGGNLVWLAVASALHTMKNFASVLGMTLKLLRDAPDWHSSRLAAAQRRGQRRARTQVRHPRDPRGRDPIAVSEEAFVQAIGSDAGLSR